MTGDYQQTLDAANGGTLFYFDPPYRPLNNTSSFNDYTKEAFNDLAQKRLRDFCNRVTEAGYQFMLHHYVHSENKTYKKLIIRNFQRYAKDNTGRTSN